MPHLVVALTYFYVALTYSPAAGYAFDLRSKLSGFIELRGSPIAPTDHRFGEIGRAHV